MKNLLILIVLLFISISCSETKPYEESLNSNDKISIEKNFLESSTNIFFLKNSSIQFSSDAISNEHINHIIDFINDKFSSNISANTIAGITTYFNKKNGNRESFVLDDVFAFSIYEVDDKNTMYHNFYAVDQDSLKLKLSLKENIVNTENQNFLVWKFFNDKYYSGSLGIKKVVNFEDNRSLRYKNQRNEFEIYRLRHIDEFLKENLKSGSYAYISSGGEECDSSCGEQGDGICDDGYYCAVDGEAPICEDDDSSDETVSKSLLSATAAEALFDLDLHYQLRDEILKRNSIGEKHISYYYAISSFILRSDYDIALLSKMIATLPSFNQKVNTLLSDNTIHDDEVVLTNQLKIDIFNIIDDLEQISDNVDYQYILSDLRNDLNLYEGLTKTQIIDQLN